MSEAFTCPPWSLQGREAGQLVACLHLTLQIPLLGSRGMVFHPCFQVSPSNQNMSCLNLILTIFITELPGASLEEMLTEEWSDAIEFHGSHQAKSAHTSYTLLKRSGCLPGAYFRLSSSRVCKVPVSVPLVTVTAPLGVSIQYLEGS